MDYKLMDHYRDRPTNNGRRREIFTLIDQLNEEGYHIINVNKHTQFRINGIVDVYPYSGRICDFNKREWLDSEPHNLRDRIDAIIFSYQS